MIVIFLSLLASCHCNGQTNRMDICNQPIKRGNCLAYMPSWAFDKSVGRCVPFVYGGCGGNENRFRSIEECENACRPSVRSNFKK
nr:Kunitz protein 8 [Hymenolepis microstoma]